MEVKTAATDVGVCAAFSQLNDFPLLWINRGLAEKMCAAQTVMKKNQTSSDDPSTAVQPVICVPDALQRSPGLH